MSESLRETKRRLSEKYVGRGKIHGFGIREAENVIRVYVEDEDSPEQQELLKKVIADAAPFPVEVTKEKRSSLS